MNDNKSTSFLTASGILVAILLVWAQLWFTTAQQYGEPNTITAKYGLSYVYIAVLFSLIAFTLTVYNAVNRWSIIFFGYSLILTAILVFGSLFSIVYKTLSELPMLSPSIPSWFEWFFKEPVWGVIVAPVGLLILWSVICNCCPCMKNIIKQLGTSKVKT